MQLQSLPPQLAEIELVFVLFMLAQSCNSVLASAFCCYVPDHCLFTMPVAGHHDLLAGLHMQHVLHWLHV
jgi:hypothetical protein